MPNRINPPLPSRTRDAAKRLRAASTGAERKLWFHLRNGRLAGLKFRRQHPIPLYVADFHCEAARLVVELDGSQHEERIDRSRSEYLANQGLRILRFWDNDVLQDTEAVLELILTIAQERTLTPAPLPMGEGRKAKLFHESIESQRD